MVISMDSDLINLNELKSLYGDDSAKELLEMSLHEGQDLITALKKSIPARDTASVAADAHQLKGMTATMTMTRLSELAYKLELSAKSQTWEECDSLVVMIDACFSELAQFLSKVFA
jgi:HPt (histidine-containing phosphotransfer) domain-containing protein